MRKELEFLLSFATKGDGLKKAQQDVKVLAEETKKARDASGRFVATNKQVVQGLNKGRDALGRFTAGARGAKAASDQAGRSFLQMFGSKVQAGFGKAREGLTKLGTGLRKLRGFATSATAALAAVGLGLSLGAVVSTLAEFEFEMARIGAVTGATGLELEALTDTARQLGAETVFSATEAAEGLRNLAQAGFSTNEAMAAIQGTLDLAVAGSVDLATATDITASVLRGFNLAASEAGRVADVLAETANASNSSVQELGEAMKFVAPVASTVGVSLEETAAAIGVLSDAGLKGTNAGTGLRRILSGLVNPTEEAATLLAQLGLTLDDVSLRSNSLETVLGRLKSAGVGAAEAFKLFDVRGGPAALVLIRMSERLKDLTGRARESEGAARAVAEILGGTLKVKIDEFKSAIEELILQQSGFSDGLKSLVQDAIGIARALGGSLDPLDANADRYREIAETLKSLGAALKFTIELLGLILSPLLAVVEGFGKLVRWVSQSDSLLAKLTRTIGEGLIEKVKSLAGALSFLAGGFVEAFEDGSAESRRAMADFNAELDRNVELLAKVKKEGLRGEDLIVISGSVQNRIDKTLAQTTALGRQLAEVRAEFERTGDPALLQEAEELDDALRRASVQLQKLGELSGQASAAQAGLERIRKITQDFAAESEAMGENIAAAFQKAGEAVVQTRKDFEESKFELEQVKLGVGAEQDIQREVRAALRKAGLASEADLAAPFEGARVAVQEQIRLIEQQREALGPLRDDEMALFADRIAAQQENLKRIDAAIAGRRQERNEIARTAAELEREKQAFEAAEEAATKAKEAREALAKAQAAFDTDIEILIANMQEEQILIGLGTRAREEELTVLNLVNTAKQQGVQLTEDQIDQVRAAKRALDEAMREDVGAVLAQRSADLVDAMTDTASQVARVFDTTFQGLEDSLMGFIETGKFEFREFATSILKELARIGIQRTIGSVLGALGGGGAGSPSGLGGLIAGLFSEGGESTKPTRTARVPAAAFAGARRFATGGVTGTDTIPAMLSPGEAVVPLSRGRSIPVEMAGGGAGGIVVNFTVNARDADSFEKNKEQIMAQMSSALQRAQSRNN